MPEVVLRVTMGFERLQEVDHLSPTLILPIITATNLIRELCFAVSDQRDNRGRLVYHLDAIRVWQGNADTHPAQPIHFQFLEMETEA